MCGAAAAPPGTGDTGRTLVLGALFGGWYLFNIYFNMFALSPVPAARCIICLNARPASPTTAAHRWASIHDDVTGGMQLQVAHDGPIQLASYGSVARCRRTA